MVVRRGARRIDPDAVLRQAARAVSHRGGSRPGARCLLPAHGGSPGPRRRRGGRVDQVPLPRLEIRRRRRLRRDPLRQEDPGKGQSRVLARHGAQRRGHGVARQGQPGAHVGPAGLGALRLRRVERALAPTMALPHPQPGDGGEHRRHPPLPVPARHGEPAGRGRGAGRTDPQAEGQDANDHPGGGKSTDTSTPPHMASASR